jgi:type IV secretory pathway VirD2 relaxase
MNKNEKREQETGFSLPQPSSSDLRGRQSVRATFRLTERAIDAISIVSVHLGIKQKSLFDHLIEDTESLNVIAQEVQSDLTERSHRIQKTYVLSRKTLSSLDKISKIFETPRDALVEYSIQRLLPLIARERKRHRVRKEIMKDFTQYIDQGSTLLRKSKEVLGEDDPVSDKIEAALITLINANRQIESFVEKGEIIENF